MTSPVTGYRPWRRYREGGWSALADRSCTPHLQPRRVPAAGEQQILAARRELKAGPLVIAAVLEHPPSTVGKCCAGPAACGFRARGATRACATSASARERRADSVPGPWLASRQPDWLQAGPHAGAYVEDPGFLGRSALPPVRWSRFS